VDLSGLIFVALAVAWAVYLIPKALRHHEDVVRSRSVDRFSHTMRVLARREPVNRRNARLVVTPGRPASQSEVAVKGEPIAAPVDARARRKTTNGAARRRRRVLILLLMTNLAVVGVAAAQVIGWVWVAVPAGLLVAWLVACRLMVRSERGRKPSPVRVFEPVDDVAETAERPAVMVDAADTDSFAAVVTDDGALWDPVPVTLPTYVGKPAARRTVRTIDLDATGVWTSGRTESDSRLAREAEEAERTERAAGDTPDAQDQAVGS
jgi:hypothetical protein